MKEISHVGKEMLAFQERLAKEFGYKPIGFNFFVGDVRQKYFEALPEWCDVSGNGNMPLLSLAGTRISTGYTRIVIGDYGAFVEISPDQIYRENIHCKPGQEYRIADERYSKNTKYHWLTAKDNSDCKIYFQQKTVDYADYLPGMYYISPYEVLPEGGYDGEIYSI